MPSIIDVISAIVFELAAMSHIVVTTSRTTSPALLATVAALAASAEAFLADSALCWTVATICSIDAVVCYRLDACSSVR